MSHVLQQLSQTGITSGSYLANVYEVEDILLVIHNMNNKIQHLKGLKDYRIEKLNDQISKYEQRVDQLRELVLNTVKHHAPDTKKFEFPEIGNVVRRVTKGSWDIEDDDKVIAFLKVNGRDKEVLIPVKPKLDRKKAKEIVTEYQDKGINVPGVAWKKESENISVSFEMGNDGKSKAEAIDSEPVDQIFPDVQKVLGLEV